MRHNRISLREKMSLDHTSSVPLHRQIAQWLRRAIRDGQLPPGQFLPSTRTLASELAISRNTASTVYEQLQAEGYLERTVGIGTRVASFLAEAHPGERPASQAPSSVSTSISSLELSPFGRAVTERIRNGPAFLVQTRPPEARAFRLGMPALDLFPYALWGQLLSRHARRSLPTRSDYQESVGYRPLREAIAAHIALTRGVRCQADQLLITSGAQAAVDLVARLLVERGDRVWVEDPGYPGAWVSLEGAGAHLISVPVDANGMQVAQGRMLAPGARLAYVTPSHQFPVGVNMSLAQRVALLHWAREANAWIVEDDYDSEFRFSARPLQALQGLDQGDRVIYVGTFSKALFPSIRLGYLVVPDPLMELFVIAQRFVTTHPPVLEQMALADFLAQGHFARHLRRMRGLYEARRDALLAAINSLCGHLLQAHAPEAGMHLVGWLPAGMADTKIEQRAAERGIEAIALSSLSRQPLPQGGLVLGFAACNEEQIQAGVRTLAQVLDEVS
jgi:GntR family transcriptional regulator/MocR family aminotransferase